MEEEASSFKLTPTKSFIIRVWGSPRAQEKGGSNLIIRLEDPLTGQTFVFQQGGELIRFLEKHAKS